MPADFSHCDLFIYMQQRFKYSSNLNTFLFHALCFPNSLLAEILLRINKYFAALVNFAVAAVQLENMCLDSVCQLDAENMLHSLLHSSSSTGNMISTRLSRFLGIQSALPM